MRTNFQLMPLRTIAPDIQLTDPTGAAVDVQALVFVDADTGNMHAFVLDEKGQAELKRQLTGGIVIANGNDLPK